MCIANILFQGESMKIDVKKEIGQLINNELQRLKENIILIGSANLPFKSVLYSYNLPLNYNPIERFGEVWISPGCIDCNSMNRIGNQLALEFFNHPNGYLVTLNPLSGTQANQIVFNACLNGNDTVLTLNQKCGGHVSNISFLEKHCSVKFYGIQSNDIISYDDILTKVLCIKPKLVIAGASSYPRLFDYRKLSDICKASGALLLADVAHTGLYESICESVSPFGYADFISFTTHKATRGPRGGVLYYRMEYNEEIQESTQKITQCAPRYTDIISKSLMFSEWTPEVKYNYVEKIRTLTNFMCNYMKKCGEKLYTDGTDIHYIVIDISNKKLSAIEIQRRLESVGILVDICYVPKFNHLQYNGLRIGVLMLATLKYTILDIQEICKILIDIINENYRIDEQKKLVLELTSKYSTVMASLL